MDKGYELEWIVKKVIFGMGNWYWISVLFCYSSDNCKTVEDIFQLNYKYLSFNKKIFSIKSSGCFVNTNKILIETMNLNLILLLFKIGNHWSFKSEKLQ